MPTFSFWEPQLSLAQPWRVPPAVAVVGTDTHHRDGIVLHIDVDRLLFGQRQELAGMEGPPQRDVLAGSRRSWSAPHRARAASIPPVCCRELMRTLKAAGGQGKQSNDG